MDGIVAEVYEVRRMWKGVFGRDPKTKHMRREKVFDRARHTDFTRPNELVTIFQQAEDMELLYTI